MKSMRFNKVMVNIVIALVLTALAVVSFTSGTVAATAETEGDKPIYRGNGLDDSVSLMINVYWGTEFVAPMLDVLKEYGAHSTFFIGGTWAVDNIELMKRMLAEGHELGNHGYFHRDHKKLPYAKNKQEIETCHITVKSLTGIDMNLFAPPSGAFGNDTLKAAKELGYRTIMWSRDTIDWRDKNADTVYERATKGVTAGELILMHPTEHTLKALPRILEYYRANKLTARTVTLTL